MELGRLIFGKEPGSLVAERLQKAGPTWTEARQNEENANRDLLAVRQDEEAAGRKLAIAKQKRKAAGREGNAAKRALITVEKEYREVGQETPFLRSSLDNAG